MVTGGERLVLEIDEIERGERWSWTRKISSRNCSRSMILKQKLFLNFFEYHKYSFMTGELYKNIRIIILDYP